MTGHRTILAVAALAIAALALGGASQADDTKSPATPAPRRPPGERVLCAMGIYNAVAEVGRRGLPGQDPEFRAELGLTVARIDDYVLRNASLAPADPTRFKREQAFMGAPEAELCRAEWIGMDRQAASAGAQRLGEETSRLLERPGTPTLGDCLQRSVVQEWCVT